MRRLSVHIYGKPIDPQTRCVHYASDVDVVAIEFACCRRFYPCYLCHEQTADHPAEQWPRERQDEHAILCGVCRGTMTIAGYLATDRCANCGALFNEGCRLHRHLYFQ